MVLLVNAHSVPLERLTTRPGLMFGLGYMARASSPMRLSHNPRSSEERIASVPVSRQDIRCVWWFREGALPFFFREIPAGSSWGRAVEGDTGGLENNARPGTQPQNMYAAYKREKRWGE